MIKAENIYFIVIHRNTTPKIHFNISNKILKSTPHAYSQQESHRAYGTADEAL